MLDKRRKRFKKMKIEKERKEKIANEAKEKYILDRKKIMNVTVKTPIKLQDRNSIISDSAYAVASPD
jgi:hypothetical protein